MKRLILVCCFLLFSGLGITVTGSTAGPSTTSTTPLPSNEETFFAASKRTVLDLSGTLINDGFRDRDGVWNISLTPGETSLLEVTLFEGNQYWFVAAATPPAKALKITCYDHEGHPIKLDSWKDSGTTQGAKSAAGFLAPKSGSYFVGLSLSSAHENQKVDASLVYAYK
ncbi:MAG: hypothetical protein K2W99_06090 [Chthoniobacterales bacterium]|nr:hypothetical protein [Chthoniobacterales bacterium]